MDAASPMRKPIMAIGRTKYFPIGPTSSLKGAVAAKTRDILPALIIGGVDFLPPIRKDKFGNLAAAFHEFNAGGHWGLCF